jgi:hypothetical protein
VKREFQCATLGAVPGSVLLMAEARLKQQQTPEATKPPQAPAHVPPDEVARRELVEWCKAHGLPVPPDRRGKR